MANRDDIFRWAHSRLRAPMNEAQRLADDHPQSGANQAAIQTWDTIMQLFAAHRPANTGGDDLASDANFSLFNMLLAMNKHQLDAIVANSLNPTRESAAPITCWAKAIQIITRVQIDYTLANQNKVAEPAQV